MTESPSADRQPRVPASSSPSPRHQLPPPIVLWRLRGATDELCGVVIETSFGLALGLELDTELVLLHLQPNWDTLAIYADRLASALISQGWQVVSATAERRH
jgi:hypothetical protein